MIAILLCTYNGEKYLSEQLDSLLSQTYKDFEVFIHDDGSTDATMSVITKYVDLYPNIIHVVEDSITHRGAAKSFFYLLGEIEADYYMFCDQDDVWLPFKIEHTFLKMKNFEKAHQNCPLLIHTDLHVCDSNLNIVHNSFWEYRHLLVDVCKSFKYLCFGNIVTGCTMMINQKAKNVVFPYSDETYIHDYWIALKVAKCGFIDNLKEQTILYRQHGDNTAGIGAEFKWGIHVKPIVQWWKYERPIIKELGYGSDWKIFIYRFRYFLMRYFNCK